MIIRFRFFVLLVFSFVCVYRAEAACVVSGSTANCTGTFVPAEFPITFSADVDGVNQMVLDATVDATVVDQEGFRLFNSDAAATADLEMMMASGAMLNRTGASRDSVFIRNRGNGNVMTTINGAITGDQRGVRSWTDLATSTGTNTINVGPGGLVDTGETSLWIRNQSLGGANIMVEGSLDSGDIGAMNGFRAVHISQNNTASAQPVNVVVSAMAQVFANHQSLYVGHAGTGLTTIDVSGNVRSGGNPIGRTSMAGAVILELESGGAQVNVQTDGLLQSLNDVAILDSDAGLVVASASTIINNAGTVYGFVQLQGADDRFVNSADGYYLRDFRDSDFDGIRDTENVAVSDFGDGADQFDNAGTLALMTVADMTASSPETDDDTSPTMFNSSGAVEYFPAGSAAIANTTAAVEQGHIINLEIFNHSGVITLADTDTGGTVATAGDTLIITGGVEVGMNGSGVFQSDGGELRLDTVLNDGTSDTTDALVVDSVVLGSGPTTVSITNVGGAGGATGSGPTDGILVIEVLDPTASDAGAFVLNGGTITAGIYEYSLVQADGQNWYLQAAAAADVSMDKTLTSAGPYAVGDVVSYDLVVTNNGPDVATNIVVSDTLTNLNLVSLSAASCVPAAFPCTIPTLANGASETITLSASIVSDGMFDNSATAVADEFDNDLSNNTDDTGNSGATAAADVAISKSITTTGPYAVGQSVDFEIIATNNGPDAATNVVIQDTPTNLTLTSVSGASCVAFPCTIAVLNPGESATIAVTASIDSSGQFINTVDINADQFDPDPANDTDSVVEGANAGSVQEQVPTTGFAGLLLLILLVCMLAASHRKKYG